jgi:hypothetical protein
MTDQQQAFINKIAPLVQKYAPQFGIKVCSPIIAQAILESGWGTTDKARYNNFFGIKYYAGRVPSSYAPFYSQSSEQRPDGSYYPIICQWCAFASVEDGIKGYFEFLMNSPTHNYDNLKGITDPHKYLEVIRADGYATSLKYVENVYKRIVDYNLTAYDPKIIEYKTNYAAKGNYGSKRPISDIGYIALHYTANDGDTDEGNGNYFKNNIVKASAHYFVDDDSVTQSVPDDYVAWSVGGKKYTDCAQTGGGSLYGIAKNQNTISIELCDTVKDGTIYPTQATINNALILTRSLMEKYGIALDHVIRHFDVTGKHCPAYWMNYGKWRDEFLLKLGSSVPADTVPSSESLYRVQVGAYKIKANAVLMQNKLRKAGFDNFIKEMDGYYKVQCGAYSIRANAEALKTRLMQKGFQAIIV